MRKSFKILATIFALSMSFGIFSACKDDEKKADTSSSGQSSSSTVVLPGDSQQVVVPTAEKIVYARANALQSTLQGYDFNINFSGTFGVLGIEKTLEANYLGQYRYNTTNNDLQFKRVTSGELLFDSTEYVCTKNTQKVQVKMNADNEVKKVSVVPNEDENLVLINKPFVSIVDHLVAEELKEIKKSEDTYYDFEAKLHFTSENPYINTLCGVIGNLGTSISCSGATFTNPLGGIQLLFNLDENEKLEDFKFTLTVNIPVKLVTVDLVLTYEQRAADTQIVIPQTAGILMETADISRELTTINNALTALKAEADYSLDLFAENEFDPAWNKLATVDSYTGRLYKHTDGQNVWFNHSYKYKAHHEEDGAEAYEYAIGNIEDGTVYTASYKGKNTYTVTNEKTVDTQFDYMISPVLQSATNIDCAKILTKGTSKQYIFYLNQEGTISLQNTILNIINSNTADGVIPINNYFNTEYIVKEAEIVVNMEDGKILDVQCFTELKYCPTGGEFTEYNITLTNTIKLAVNKNLDKAQKYKAPGKADGMIDNLESIL